MKTKSRTNNHAAGAKGAGKNPPNAATARACHIGQRMVREGHKRLLIAKRTGNLDPLRELVDILNDAMDQVGNQYGHAKNLYCRKEGKEGQSHE